MNLAFPLAGSSYVTYGQGANGLDKAEVRRILPHLANSLFDSMENYAMAAPRGGFTMPARPRDGKRIPGFVKWHGEKETATMHLRVLGYKEDGEWCALCLEMDLRGYGATFEEAMDELHNTIVDQFTFAMQMNNPDLLTFGTEQRYHAMYARAQQAAMSDYITGAHEATRNQLISELPVPLVEHIPSGMYAPAWQ